MTTDEDFGESDPNLEDEVGDEDQVSQAPGFRKTQFGNGQRRNSRGRPRGSKNRKTIVRDVMFEKHWIAIERKRIRLTCIEIILTQLRNKAAKADYPALRLYEKFMNKYVLDERHAPPAVFFSPETLTYEEWEEKHKPKF
jgi:hypothetical protein